MNCMNSRKEQILIRIAGKDRIGLTAEIMGVLARYDAQILDIGQADIHSTLSLGILIRIDENLSGQVMKELLFKTTEMGVTIGFAPVTDDEYEAWAGRQGRNRYILTAIGRSLSAWQIEAATKIIARHNLNIDAIKRLTGRMSIQHPERNVRACVEFSIRGSLEDREAFQREFMALSNESEIDFSFQKDDMYRRMRRLICFDMDSTLIQAECIDELARRHGVYDKVAAITERAMRGEIDFRESFTERVALLKGLDVSVMKDIAENLPVTEGTDRLNIEIPGISGVAETNKILEELGRPGSLYFIRQTDDEGNQNYQYGITEEGSLEYVLTKEFDQLEADGDIVLDGTHVTEAKAGYQKDDMGNSEVVVSLTFDDEGKKAFADATTKAYAAGESIGIYYDGHFISVPNVQAAITDGRAVITGESSIEDAQNLASTIRIGGLKVELERLRSQIVGAQLGQDAIRTSKIAGVVGFGLVALFMIVIYLLPGFAAVLALVIYILMMALVLNGFDITLTLPGIAGILLSVGMAVDANVIIFARIREELATGIGVKTAMKNGFHKALSAIIDGNVTTLIAAAVLGFLGSGTVKGFAITLAIGIVLSMFTALFVTRFLMNIFYGLGLTDKKLYGEGKKRGEIAFVEHRNIFFAISIALVLSGFVAMGIYQVRQGNALNYSLDFVGGTSTNVSFNEDMSLEEIDSTVVPVFTDVTGDNNVQVQKVSGSNEVIFKSVVLDEDTSTELSNRLVEEFGVDKDSITSETISSTISSEMKRDALVAVAVALVLMLLYIWFRFKDMRFGASSVICLVHDVLVVLTFYAIARISVGSTFIACMLTIVGYSINATIVIFDRVRENIRYMKRGTLMETIDQSISLTFGRSLMTSITTIIVMVPMVIMAGDAIREFVFPLMCGVIAGTYSSICVCSPIYFELGRSDRTSEYQKQIREAEKKAKKKAKSGKKYVGAVKKNDTKEDQVLETKALEEDVLEPVETAEEQILDQTPEISAEVETAEAVESAETDAVGLCWSRFPVCSSPWHCQYHDHGHFGEDRGNRCDEGTGVLSAGYPENVSAGSRLHRPHRRRHRACW